MDDARQMPHADLEEALDALLAEYDPPSEPETQGQQVQRLTRTIDEMPGMYRYMVQLWSYLDNVADSFGIAYGTKDAVYKAARQRRDLLDKYTSAAKLRYEAASRIITVMTSFDANGMPTTRRGD